MTQTPGGWEVLAVVVPVPPFTCLLQDLAPATNYSLRVRCANALGPSPYADWVPFRTKGLGKDLLSSGLTGPKLGEWGGIVLAPVPKNYLFIYLFIEEWTIKCIGSSSEWS